MNGKKFDPLYLYGILLPKPACIIAANALGRILYASERCEDLLGWNNHELVGQSIVVIIPERLRAAHLKGFTMWATSNELKNAGVITRTHALHKNGTEIAVEIVYGAFSGSEGDARILAHIRARGDFVDIP